MGENLRTACGKTKRAGEPGAAEGPAICCGGPPSRRQQASSAGAGGDRGVLRGSGRRQRSPPREREETEEETEGALPGGGSVREGLWEYGAGETGGARLSEREEFVVLFPPRNSVLMEELCRTTPNPALRDGRVVVPGPWTSDGQVRFRDGRVMDKLERFTSTTSCSDFLRGRAGTIFFDDELEQFSPRTIWNNFHRGRSGTIFSEDDLEQFSPRTTTLA